MISSLPTQDSVKSAWESGQVKVTCLVSCYNHQNYIFDCLKGVITQKTDFAFKVVIYDDFSTDDTRNILSLFEERYPDIIDIYYAEFNHYGVAIKEEHLNRLEGDYIALCEGDDYWIDRLKLKKQYEELKKSSAFFCVHPAVIFLEESSLEDVFCYYGNEKVVLPQSLVFGLKNQFAPTASYFMKLEKYFDYIDLRKKLNGGPGDFFMEVSASDKGISYLPDIMSSYRRGGAGSYSKKQAGLTVDDVHSELKRWYGNLDVLLAYRPHLEKFIIVKKSLVEIDCLLRMHQKTSHQGKRNEYVDKVNNLLKALGPLTYY
ncbi:glycosyltransferase family 2 protein [Halomonas sp. HL-93]|uniref:glycosyltransferase family 2 protein n=1 Tax=Halomonas sp. HL-93 TaxID=1666906 RepID=UPI0007F156C1|nr:glycosyltransferase [Halomonas sp. HL-93]SBR46100.1 Glycosyl transferase family 2 [Halomonas sp. HL-93]